MQAIDRIISVVPNPPERALNATIDLPVSASRSQHFEREAVNTRFVALAQPSYVSTWIAFASMTLSAAEQAGKGIGPGFAIMKTRTGFSRAERNLMINPKTQQKIEIPGKDCLKFRIARAAKDAFLGVKK